MAGSRSYPGGGVVVSMAVVVVGGLHMSPQEQGHSMHGSLAKKGVLVHSVVLALSKHGAVLYPLRHLLPSAICGQVYQSLVNSEFDNVMTLCTSS